MTKKDYTVNWAELSPDITYSVKNKTTLIFNSTKLDDLTFLIQNGCLVCKTSDIDTVKFSNYSGIKFVKTREEDGSILTTNIISSSLVDNTENVIYKNKKGKVTGTNYNDFIDVKDYTLYNKNRTEKDDSAKKLKGLTISSSSGDDEIYATKYKDVIKSGNGDDTIYSSLGKDTITGGTGTNTIVYRGDFDTDTINLTKNENLILDFSGIDDYYDKKFKVSGNNLLITIYKQVDFEDAPDAIISAGTIILKNFSKSNVVSSNGNIKLIFPDSNDNIEDLNNFNLLSYDYKAFNSKGVFNGSRFNETIDAREVDYAYGKNNKGVTIKGGNGYNTVYSTYNFSDTVTGGNNGNNITLYNGTKSVTTGTGVDTINVQGTGTKTIKSGKGNDIINIGGGTDEYNVNSYTVTKIYAGHGTNTINIDNSSEFGTVYVYEEKVKAVNNITFSEDFSSGYYMCRNGNNLILTNNNSMLVLVNYYKANKSNAVYNFTVAGQPVESFADLVNLTQGFVVNGKGTIKGKDYNDLIVANDSENGIKASNDNITPGKGTDVINAGKGSNNIYLYSGDGAKTIINGGGTDTLVFDNNTQISFAEDGNNLILNYGLEGDSITIKNYSLGTSVRYVQIGGAKTTLDNLYKTLSLNLNENARGVKITEEDYSTVILNNANTGQQLTYDVISLDGDQSVTYKYLENGRFLIYGSHIKITARDNQADDIILIGDNNELYSNDGNDTLRVGHVIDSNGKYTDSDGSNFNKIDSGSGDDYISFFGAGNNIDAGDGNDRVMLSYIYSNGKLVTTDEDSKIIFNYPPDKMEYVEDENTTTIKGGEDVRFFGELTPDFDYQVGWYNQGNLGGDCRLFALLDSLSKSDGFTSLADYVTISTEDNENYTVTFNNYTGTKKTSEININEIQSLYDDDGTKTMFVFGDLDVVLIDYALNDLLAQRGSPQTVQTVSYNILSSYILGNTDVTFIRYNAPEYNFSTRLESLCNKYLSGEISNLTIGINNSVHESDLGIVSGHAYSLKEYNENYITLVNPWDNADTLTLSMDKLYALNPSAIVYGVDIYNEHLILDNIFSTANDTFDTDLINSDVAAWLSTAQTDFAEFTETQDNSDINALVLNSFSPDYNTDV